MLVLNLIHNNCQKNPNLLQNSHLCNCIVHLTFQGLLQSELRCHKCNYASVTSDPFLDISLDVGYSNVGSSNMTKFTTNGSGSNISNNNNGSGNKNGKNNNIAHVDPQSLDDCLERYTKPEHSDWKCTNCSEAHQSTKQLSFKRLPPVLVFQIKVST